MNKLIITANPSSKWFTHEIAKKVTELSVKKWNKVEVLDLYKTEFKQDFLRYEDKTDIWKNEITKKIQSKITEADELIFIFPIWWWDTPAIMKNFMDCNFSTWFAFKHKSWKLIW
jgi:NAD(P)H dehydrogenase (quinone)